MTLWRRLRRGWERWRGLVQIVAGVLFLVPYGRTRSIADDPWWFFFGMCTVVTGVVILHRRLRDDEQRRLYGWPAVGDELPSPGRGADREDGVLALQCGAVIHALVLLPVAGSFYGRDHGSGLPLAPLACGLLTIALVYTVFAVDHRVRRPRGSAARRPLAAWDTAVLVAVGGVGVALPLWLAAYRPFPVLTGLSTGVGGVLVSTPGVALIAMFAYRAGRSAD